MTYPKTNDSKFASFFQLTDITSNKCLPSNAFISKVNSLYNIQQVAMSAYAINVRNYLDPCVPPKIADLLNSIRQTTNVCTERMLFHEDDYIVQVSTNKHLIDHDILTFEIHFLEVNSIYNFNPCDCIIWHSRTDNVTLNTKYTHSVCIFKRFF